MAKKYICMNISIYEIMDGNVNRKLYSRSCRDNFLNTDINTFSTLKMLFYRCADERISCLV